MKTTDPVALAAELIAIESINPDLVAGGSGETTIASFCQSWLEVRGFQTQRLESTPGRPSVVGIARGTGPGQSLMLCGHLDTVGATGTALVPTERDGRLFGRGAFDMKGGLAAILVAAERATAQPLRGDVIVALVADEEFGSIGTEEVLGAYTADAAVIAEPTELQLVLAHRGFAWFELEIAGRAAHGSMPGQGIDAIAGAGRVQVELDRYATELAAASAHPLLGHGSVRVSTIAGGVDAATVAPSCTLTIERRTLPGEAPDPVEASLREVIARTPDLEFSLTRLVARAAFEADPATPIAVAVAGNAERVLGRPAPTRGEPFWTDAGLFAEAGIPCVLLGVDGGGAHADEEWATIESIRQLTGILEGTIIEFCGQRPGHN